ncbi:cation transport ATPase [Corynespora cassiicola Philippines]|uniref:Cation transport ATPase n=1 Tax=Corynespora cassiicola Philippines TaxID=1448308 RepID=A0A2T2NJW9_CORCC|nr:cation transport ATPase [Corynespora cassiicola Philippines]
MSPNCCSNKGNCTKSAPQPSPIKKESEDCCQDERSSCGDEDSSAKSSRDVKQGYCTSEEELCDEKCIIAVAAEECAKACDNGESFDHSEHLHDHDADGGHPASACNTHLNEAFEQYKTYIETARCICRSVIERGFPSAHCREQHTKENVSHGCCGEVGQRSRSQCHSATTQVKKADHRHIPGLTRHHHTKGTHENEDKKHEGDIQPAKSDAASCCSGQAPQASSTSASKKTPQVKCSRVSNEPDLEKADEYEHFSLVVDGMTCSGCGNKLERCLKAASGVSGVRVNFVMGSAEFDFDKMHGNVDEMLKGIEKATGFKCTRLSSGDQAIDVLASGSTAKVLAELTTPGVTSVAILDKKIVRISYNPLVIGGRDLLESIEPPVTLAPPEADSSMSAGRKHLYDMSTKTIVAAIFTIPVVVLAWGEGLVDEKTRAIISIILATFVQLIAVPVFYKPAITTLIYDHSLEMDMLVTISITAAYLYSIVGFAFRMAGQPLETKEFFETSTLLITLVLLGRVVAAFARVKAVAAVSLRSLQTTMALLIQGEKEGDCEIDARLLQYGDRFRVQPHSRVPTDGRVVSGASEVDESMLTGENLPVAKQRGDHLIAGTVNGPGILEVQVTRLPGRNTVTDIAELVEEAANSKPRIQDVADRVASWFVPVVTACALITTIIWIAVGLRIRNESTGKAIADAITYAVAVLAVSCPCALGLAVPMVLVVAGGIAARGGVIIKSAQCTATAYKVTDVVFDKTGTLTESDFDVLDEVYFTDTHITNRDAAIAITKALTTGNSHPVSLSVSKYLEAKYTNIRPASSIGTIHSVPGAGVEAAPITPDNLTLRAGNPHWTNNAAHPSITPLTSTGMTVLLVTQGNEPLVLFGLRTHIRAEAGTIIAALHARGIATHLVSGDQVQAVQSVASALGIPAENVAARRTPAQKREYVAALSAATGGAENKGKKRTVLFLGDGTNDAPAVAQADVGVQISPPSSSTSDVTRTIADVVLLSDLHGLVFLLDVSRAAFNRMVFNFVWSAIYNVFAILLAAGAFVKVRIPPAYAGLGEIVSVVPVIVVGMTMRWVGRKGQTV